MARMIASTTSEMELTMLVTVVKAVPKMVVRLARIQSPISVIFPVMNSGSRPILPKNSTILSSLACTMTMTLVTALMNWGTMKRSSTNSTSGTATTESSSEMPLRRRSEVRPLRSMRANSRSKPCIGTSRISATTRPINMEENTPSSQLSVELTRLRFITTA